MKDGFITTWPSCLPTALFWPPRLSFISTILRSHSGQCSAYDCFIHQVCNADRGSAAKMGHNSDKMYVTHSEHASGDHTASSTGKRMESGKADVQRLPL